MKTQLEKHFFNYNYSPNVDLLLVSLPKTLIRIVKGSYLLVFVLLTLLCLTVTYPIEKSGFAFLSSPYEGEITFNGSERIDLSEFTNNELVMICTKSKAKIVLQKATFHFNKNSIAFLINSYNVKFCRENLSITKTPITIMLGKKRLLSIILKKGQ